MIKLNCNFRTSTFKMCLPARDGDKHLTLTAAVTHRFNTEAAIFGRYHFLAGGGGGDERVIPQVRPDKQNGNHVYFKTAFLNINVLFPNNDEK